MAYQTGSATDLADLMSLLKTFATSFCGYSLTAEQGSTNSDYTLYLTKSGKTFLFGCSTSYAQSSGTSLLTTTGFFAFVLSGAYDSGSNRTSQPGMTPSSQPFGYRDRWPTTWICDGSILEYHFFYSDDIISFCFKTSQNIWLHTCFGFARKLYTSFTGGAFVHTDNSTSNASSWIKPEFCVGVFDSTDMATFTCADAQANAGCNLQIHVEDTGAGYHYLSSYAGTKQTENIGFCTTNNVHCNDQSPDNFSPERLKGYVSFNYYGSVPILNPTLIFVQNLVTTTKFMLYADIPTVKATNMGILEEGAEVAYNGATWKIFPARRKTNTFGAVSAGIFNSYLLAIAYKKVV